MADASPSLARTAVVGFLITLVACAWLALLPAAPLHGDTSRDLLLARDLATGSELHGQGAPTAYSHFQQGTSWIDLLALGLRLELSLTGLEWMAWVLQALAVALGVVGLARMLGREADDPGLLAGGATLLATLPWLSEAPILWQPLLQPLPVVLAHLALWRLVLTGRTLDAALLGLFVAWSMDVHVVAVLLALPAALVIAAASRRPLLALLLAAGSGLGFMLVSSPMMVLSNVAVMREQGSLVPALVLLGVVTLAGLLVRRRFAALAGIGRLKLIAGLELLVVGLLVASSSLPSTPPLGPRYLLPFAPVLLVTIALQLEPARRSMLELRARAALVAGATLLLATPPMAREERSELPLRPSWRLHEIDQLAEVLAEHGYDWPAMVEHLQCSRREGMLGGLAALEREPAAIEPPADEDLIFIGLPPASVVQVERLLPPEQILARISNSGGVGLLLRLPARIRHSDAVVRLEGGEQSDWREVGLVPPPALAHLASQRAYPSSFEPDGARLHLDGETERVTWRMPFEAGPARVVSTFSSYAAPRCAWEIVGVLPEGEPSLLDEPARSAVLPAERRGWIEVGRIVAADYGEKDCAVVQDDGVHPPGTIETALEQRALRAALWLAEPGPASQPERSR